MKLKLAVVLSACAAIAGLSQPAFGAAAAADKDPFPTAVSLFPPLQAPGSGTPIYSRFSWLFGRHDTVLGLDVGLLGNITDKTFAGVAIAGLANVTNGKAAVALLQLAGLTNVNSGTAYVVGLQIAGALNINKGKGWVTGFQIAALGNVAAQSNIYGGQVGLYNVADKIYGFQIGLINVCNDLHGLQIGLLNNHKTGILAWVPVLNAGF